MRTIGLVMTIAVTILAMLISPDPLLAHPADTKESIIIEVEGDPMDHKAYIEAYYPNVEVVATYEQLFRGIALQALPEELAKMDALDFVKAVHPVLEYEVKPQEVLSFQEVETAGNLIIPSDLNATSYTGKGVKVGIIDTGIDYTHPDLKQNYVQGYDLVDLDYDPMETTPDQGAPTMHGSHVAGIIAANGDLKGVAPDAEIYAYRALGPGGVGSSIQVIAAMEQAVKDGVDIINLSLGNSVNGPDYPTSLAVNRASELGVIVVIANGNNGPNNWTVGAPATATESVAVGAEGSNEPLPHLYDSLSEKEIPLLTMVGSVPWELQKDYEITVDTQASSGENLTGKIALLERGETPFYQLALKAQQKGAIAAIIANNEKGIFQGSIIGEEEPITIPVAAVSQEDGEWLQQFAETDYPYIETMYENKENGIASFSSRGPVTVNWQIKPDLIAPGTNIVSTVPGGYQVLQGTSMAAPHVAGAVALMKEAHPNWSNEKIIGALKTTVARITDANGTPVEPIVQGLGRIQPEQALEPATIIYQPSLTFGKINQLQERSTINVMIENLSDQEQTYSFTIPKKQVGYSWDIPKSFTIDPNEKKTIPIKLSITSSFLEEGIHQGWLTLSDSTNEYHLPYLFINDTADYPKAAGFEFVLQPFSDEEYHYRLYLTEPAKHVAVELYDPGTLIHQRNLLELENEESGMVEGKLHKSEIGQPGYYYALVTVQLEDGSYESYETEVMIEP